MYWPKLVVAELRRPQRNADIAHDVAMALCSLAPDQAVRVPRFVMDLLRHYATAPDPTTPAGCVPPFERPPTHDGLVWIPPQCRHSRAVWAAYVGSHDGALEPALLPVRVDRYDVSDHPDWDGGVIVTVRGLAPSMVRWAIAAAQRHHADAPGLLHVLVDPALVDDEITDAYQRLLADPSHGYDLASLTAAVALSAYAAYAVEPLPALSHTVVTGDLQGDDVLPVSDLAPKRDAAVARFGEALHLVTPQQPLDLAPDTAWRRSEVTTYRGLVEAVRWPIRAAERAADAVRAHLCDHTASVYGRLQLAGMGRTSEGWSAQLDALYVRPTLVDGARPTDPATAIAAAPPVRWVVLGDPGSGKSTLVQYLALRAAEVNLAPLVVPLGELVDGDHVSLLDDVVTQLQRRFSLVTDRDTVAELLSQGRAILLFDGLDEVGPSLRSRVSGQLAALAGRFERAPLIVTSRSVGYGAAALPSHLFRHLHVPGFDDDATSEFAQRWLTTSGTPDANLKTALLSEGRLARTPLMATMIALLYPHEVTLPGERAYLYDELIRAVALGRTSAKGQTFDRLGEDAQVAALAALALHLQEQRTADGTSARRRALYQVAVTSLTRLGVPSPRYVASQWIDWLVTRAGLLVEVAPGMLAFAHLSFMEFLAGLSVDHDTSGADAVRALVDLVRQRAQDPAWTETLLLALGHRCDDQFIGDALFEALDLTEWDHVNLLVRALREELWLSSERRSQLLAALVTAIPRDEHTISETRATLDDLIHHSARHGKAVGAWLAEQLMTATGESLTIVAELDPRDIRETLRHRPNLAALLPHLHSVPRIEAWTLVRGDVAQPLTWGQQACVHSLLMSTTAAAAQRPDLGAALAVVTLRRAQWLRELRRGAHPAVCGSFYRRTQELATHNAVVQMDPTAASYSAPKMKAGLELFLLLNAQQFETLEWVQRLAPDELPSGRYGAELITARAAASLLPQELHGDAQALAREGAESPPLTGAPRVAPQPAFYEQPLAGASGLTAAGREVFWSFGHDLGRALELVASTGVEATHNEVMTSLLVHLRHRWVHLFYQPLTEWLTDHDRARPEMTAFLLALGLIQHATTEVWPWGSWWETATDPSTPPDTHWLVRYLWAQIHAQRAPTEPQWRDASERARNDAKALAASDPDTRRLLTSLNELTAPSRRLASDL